MTELDNPTDCPSCGQPLSPLVSACAQCGLNIPAADPPGRLLRNGELQLGRRLGGGGMGNLYLAEDTRTGTQYVVKELQAPANRKQRVVFEAMFREEAQLLARVSRESAAVPRYYDAFMDSGSFYIVIEFVPGQSLQEYTEERGGRIPVPEVIDYGTQVAEILLVIHGMHPAPVVHGDITPSNLILRPDGRVVLIDFGLARRIGEMPSNLPAYASTFGTPGYTPMEQWDGQLTPAADIFSLGATMHRSLSGRDPRTPFKGLGRITKEDLSRLTAFPLITLLAPETPPMLETLIMQMLRRRPADRPTTQEVKARLARLGTLTAS